MTSNKLAELSFKDFFCSFFLSDVSDPLDRTQANKQRANCDALFANSSLQSLKRSSSKIECFNIALTNCMKEAKAFTRSENRPGV